MPGDKWGREEVRAHLERERMASILNDTKWIRLVEALNAVRQRISLHYRVKMLTEAEVWDAGESLFLPVPDAAYIEGAMGPVPARAIEWLEIDIITSRRREQPIADELTEHSCEVAALLQSLHIPFSREGYSLRVTGHARP